MKTLSKVLIKILLTSGLMIYSINAKASENISIDISSEGYQFQPCTIDPTYKPTLDISDYFESAIDDNGVYRKAYSDPFEFYTSSNIEDAGVTLPGPWHQSTCGWKVGDNLTWNSKAEQCMLNGTFGNSETPPNTCTMLDQAQLPANLVAKWTHSNGATIMISGIPGETKPVPVTIGFGHGVLNSTCGGVALVKNFDTLTGKTNYAAIMQVDARAWSFEISQPASINLASDNWGGTCHIPDVTLLKSADVQKILAQLPEVK